MSPILHLQSPVKEPLQAAGEPVLPAANILQDLPQPITHPGTAQLLAYIRTNQCRDTVRVHHPFCHRKNKMLP